MIRNRWLDLAMAAVVAGGSAGCSGKEERPVALEANDSVLKFPGMVACPDHGGLLGWNKARDSQTVNSVALAGPSTLIPEFNDCQRLIDPMHHYGTLAAIWAPTAYKGTVMDSLRDGRAVAAAVIHAWDGSYAPLGIVQGWNCLYLVGQPDVDGLRARMKRVADASECIGTIDSARLSPEKLLSVERKAIVGLANRDYPDVARWDRDHDRAMPFEYIGMKCGIAWCEIHADKKQSFITSDRYSPSPGTVPRNRRVFEAKGWYDEQYLDVGSGAAKTPLSVLGTIFPVPALDTLTVKAFSGSWVHAGIIVLSSPAAKYQTTFGLAAGDAPRRNEGADLTRVDLCWNGMNDSKGCSGVTSDLVTSCKWDPAKDRGNRWYSRTTGPGGSSIYKCVIRQDHSSLGTHIPGTARWNWQEDDATQWFRCDQGCCSIKP